MRFGMIHYQKVLRMDIILTQYQPNLPSPWARKPVLWPRAMEDSAYSVLITMSNLGTIWSLMSASSSGGESRLSLTCLAEEHDCQF